MKQIFAFESMAEYESNANSIQALTSKLERYKERLVHEFELKVLPKLVLK